MNERANEAGKDDTSGHGPKRTVRGPKRTVRGAQEPKDDTAGHGPKRTVRGPKPDTGDDTSGHVIRKR